MRTLRNTRVHVHSHICYVITALTLWPTFYYPLLPRPHPPCLLAFQQLLRANGPSRKKKQRNYDTEIGMMNRNNGVIIQEMDRILNEMN